MERNLFFGFAKINFCVCIWRAFKIFKSTLQRKTLKKNGDHEASSTRLGSGMNLSNSFFLLQIFSASLTTTTTKTTATKTTYLCRSCRRRSR